MGTQQECVSVSLTVVAITHACPSACPLSILPLVIAKQRKGACSLCRGLSRLNSAQDIWRDTPPKVCKWPVDPEKMLSTISLQGDAGANRREPTAHLRGGGVPSSPLESCVAVLSLQSMAALGDRVPKEATS